MSDLKILIASIIIELFTIYKLIHIMQLNSYNIDQQIIWFRKNINLYLANLLLLISTILYILNYEKVFSILFLIIIYICLLVILIENLPRKQKKKLVWTKRIIRLLICMTILFAILHIINNKFFIKINNYSNFLIVSFSPLICFVSFLIMTPIEKLLKQKYINEAKNILRSNNNITTIGITGSFGKTSVKYFLNSVLRDNYNVCMTKGSFNTPMGVVITIRNELRNYDEYFICEMGARRIGDIKEICDIVNPTDCIITEVGDQHLDTFKNITNVLHTKFELVDSVYNNKNDNSIILINGDNDLIKNYAIEKYNYNSIKTKKLIYTYGLNNVNDFYAKNIKTNINGTAFIFVNTINNTEEEFNTKLLGAHNVINLVASISYAVLKNINMNIIQNSISKIQTVEHRLEIKKINENNIIIDDCYNSNVKGARYAIDILNSFTDYTKILITPGIVELGDKQYAENKNFILYANDKTDYILIVGKTNKEALMEGNKNSIYFDKIEQAINYALNNINGNKKIILLENDLPDNY